MVRPALFCLAGEKDLADKRLLALVIVGLEKCRTRRPTGGYALPCPYENAPRYTRQVCACPVLIILYPSGCLSNHLSCR